MTSSLLPQGDDNFKMRFFRKKQIPENMAVQTCVGSQTFGHPFNDLKHHTQLPRTELRLYETLREAVPIIDAALSKIIRLIGSFEVECIDNQVSYQLNKFLSDVRVNSCNYGTESFISSYLDQLLTFGTAVGEIIPTVNGKDIYALYNSSLYDIEFRTNGSPLNLEIYRREPDNQSVLIDFPDLILMSALNPKPGHVCGTSILQGLPFVSNILLSIYNSIGLNFDRVGNVRFAVTYKPSNDSTDKAYAKERAMQIAKEWHRAMHDANGVSDFVAVGDVNIKVIGADNQILDSQIPVRQMLEQIVSKLSIPPFLLGLSWSTTERMSTQQADILTSELEFYRRMLNPIISKICSTWMRLNGCYSDFRIIWDSINLQDEVQLANARLLSARAKEIEKKINTL